jgi:nitric oxide reductase subunit B
MSQTSDSVGPIMVDRVSNVLKWILLAVAVVSFALFAWATVLTYERAPSRHGPLPAGLKTARCMAC